MAITSDGSRARAAVERPSPSNSGISPNTSPASMSATTRLPSVDRLVGERDAPGQHDEQLVGLVVLLEQHIAAAQLAPLGCVGDAGQLLLLELREEIDAGQEVGVGHPPQCRWPHTVRVVTGVVRSDRPFLPCGSGPLSVRSLERDDDVRRRRQGRLSASRCGGHREAREAAVAFRRAARVPRASLGVRRPDVDGSRRQHGLGRACAK